MNRVAFWHLPTGYATHDSRSWQSHPETGCRHVLGKDWSPAAIRRVTDQLALLQHDPNVGDDVTAELIFQ